MCWEIRGKHKRKYYYRVQRRNGRLVKTYFRSGRAAQRAYEEDLQRRKDREQELVQNLTKQPQSIDELLPIIYKDIPDSTYPYASRSMLASLIKLEEDGICKNNPTGWFLNV